MVDLVTVLLPQINAEVEYHLGSNHPLRHEVALNALQQLLVWKMDTVALAVAEAILETTVNADKVEVTAILAQRSK